MQSSPILTVDTEGTLNHPFSETWGLSVPSEYFAFNHRIGANLPGEWLPELKEVIENHPCLNFHHAKHDLRALRNLGINYQGKFYDTMLMAHMVNENIPSKELDYLSRYYGGEPKRQSEVMKKIVHAFGWHAIPVEYIRPYGANDAYITEELFNSIKLSFDNQGFDGELWDWEQKFVRLLAKIEDNGVLVDQELACRELERGLKIMAEIQNALEFNPSSPTELGKFLLEDLNLPVVNRTKAGKPSFDKNAMKVYDELLQRANDERAQQILTYRGWQKVTSSCYKPYLDKLSPQDGRLRSNYKMHGTVTGRLSCSLFQQIPRVSTNPWNGHLKKVFIVEQGRVPYEADYSQLEFRLGAAYGKEKALIEVFNDPERSVFKEMAASLNMEYNDVKTQHYTIQYGGGAGRVSEVFGLSLLAAKARITQYRSEYPGLAKVSQLAARRCLDNSYVQYWTGRRRHFDDPQSQAHKAFNSVIQGGAFEIVKRAMIKLDEAGLNNPECVMDLQVHDSVRFDIEEGKEHIYLPEIKAIMEDVKPDFGVKFKVDIHKWGE